MVGSIFIYCYIGLAQLMIGLLVHQPALGMAVASPLAHTGKWQTGVAGWVPTAAAAYKLLIYDTCTADQLRFLK